VDRTPGRFHNLVTALREIESAGEVRVQLTHRTSISNCFDQQNTQEGVKRFSEEQFSAKGRVCRILMSVCLFLRQCLFYWVSSPPIKMCLLRALRMTIPADGLVATSKPVGQYGGDPFPSVSVAVSTAGDEIAPLTGECAECPIPPGVTGRDSASRRSLQPWRAIRNPHRANPGHEASLALGNRTREVVASQSVAHHSRVSNSAADIS
jgi:hypothetical protein